MQRTLPDTTRTRLDMIETCKAMNAAGINQGTSGNVSVRTDKAMLITPSGIPYEEMRPNMMVALPLDWDGVSPVQGKPSTEWRFHRDLLLARPDMPVVLHAHPTQATALAIQRLPIPAIHYMVAAFGGDDIPLAGYATFGTAALSAELTKVMAKRHGCLMANHGATVLGETLAKALWRMQELEVLAEQYNIVRATGTPVLLPREEIDTVLVAFQSYGPSTET